MGCYQRYGALIHRLRRLTQIKKMTDENTYKIIGCAMEVHKELGCGFLEAVCQESLDKEFKNQKVPYKSQPAVQIFYKNKLVD